MSPRESRSLVLSLVVVAAASVAVESTASAQGTAPKQDEPAKAAPAAPAAAPASASTKAGDAKADSKAAPAATTPATATAPAADGEKPAETPKPEEEKKRAVYISADIGFVRADIGGLSDATGLDKTGANGAVAGLGIGYRYTGFRIGGRFRSASTTEYTLWSLMGEVGYGLPMRPISPLFLVHAGYIFDIGVERSLVASSLPPGNVLTPNVQLDGVVVGGEITATYWFTSFLRMGPFIGFDATILSRAKADLPQSIFPISDETRAKALYSEAGTGLGYMLNIGLRGTGDIAF